MHKKYQAELKLRHRHEFHDNGFVFCKDWSEVGRKFATLGDPLSVNNLGQREFGRLIAAANVKPITLHGLHTCASLLLAAGVPPNVVQQRLGHKRIEKIMLSIYAHVLPGQQRDAARRLSSLLYGR